MKWSSLSTTPWILPALFLIFISNQSHSEIVQRWKDAQGQWHFGDAAASQGHASQPVPIQNPISVVQNEHPTPIKAQSRQPSRSSHARTTKTRTNKQLSQQCDKMREEIYQQRHRDRAKLLNRYEKQCITGNYYGN